MLKNPSKNFIIFKNKLYIYEYYATIKKIDISETTNVEAL